MTKTEGRKEGTTTANLAAQKLNSKDGNLKKIPKRKQINKAKQTQVKPHGNQQLNILV